MHKAATLLIASLMLLFLASLWPSQAQDQPSDPLEERIEALMQEMSTAEKVGQLFLVTFNGSDVGRNSDIADLITSYKIGGVVLSAHNGNISNSANTPAEVAMMNNRLQARARESTQRPTSSIEPDAMTPESPADFIPLFIAIEHEGDAFPFTSLINGFTPVPNNMAIGATWNPEHARTVGRIVGQELAAVGINMLLGPSLDVLDTPHPTGRGDLGTRTFGGDPFWVGAMGQAYITGVHEGSRRRPEEPSRVAVVAKHFPGHGGSDRQVNEEVSLVQKSLEELKKIELAPFLAVTQPPDSLARTDALMTAHISYRGFQGNIREQTKPISVDKQAMSQVLELPELAAWRQGGGVIVSNALGVRAIQRFYDFSPQEFNGKRIAVDAFQAGNDLLYLSDYSRQEGATWEDQLVNMKDTINHFRSKYEQDPLFSEQVDASVRRILRLKLQLYPQFSLEAAQANLGAINDRVGQERDQVFQIAKDAITLIAPESANFIVDRPAGDEKIVILTDDRQLPDTCPAPICQPEPDYIAQDALAGAILRLYGPEGTEEISPENVQSFSFSDLLAYLAPAPIEEPTELVTETLPSPVVIETALEEADWVVFAMLDVHSDNSDTTTSNAVKQFLNQSVDLTQDKRVIVLAYNSPYYLDATEIGKLYAYYGLYSRVEPFVEASARMLLGDPEFFPTGDSPVSIEGVNYDMLEQTAPDPNQPIHLDIFAINGRVITGTQTSEANTPVPTPEEWPEVKVDDILTLRTGVILDHNGHVVPDDTPVEFLFTYLPDEGGRPVPIQVGTKNGVAETDFTLERAEPLAISARSKDAQASESIRLIPGEKPEVIAPPTPTPTSTPTNTPTPTSTPTPTPSPTPTPTSTPTPTATTVPTIEAVLSPPPEPTRRVGWSDLALVIIATLAIGAVGFVVGCNDGGSSVVGVRLLLWIWMLGMAGYVLYAIGTLETLGVYEQGQGPGALPIGIIGGLLPLGVYVTSERLVKRLR